jgi:hypothetical protein
MLTGMFLGVIFYRPIFGELLRSADAKEWMKDTKNLKEEPVKQSILKTDTTNRGNTTIYASHTKKAFDYKGGIKFNQIVIDTLLKENEGFSSSVIKDTKPIYSDIILSTPLKIKFIFLIWIMIIFVTMVYGPVAAFLVELFPTKIRYTSMSLPYHIGNGVFGGLVPFIATLLSATFTGDPLVGLWYPIGVAALCFVIGTLYLSNKKPTEI